MATVILINTTNSQFKRLLEKTGELSYDGYVVKFKVDGFDGVKTSRVTHIQMDEEVVAFTTKNSHYSFLRTEK